LAEIPPTRFSTGTAVYSAFRQIGTALGVAVWLAVLGTASITNASSFVYGWVVITAIAAATSVAVLSTPRRASAESPRLPAKPLWSLQEAMGKNDRLNRRDRPSLKTGPKGRSSCGTRKYAIRSENRNVVE
jgi:hypothetical protein